MSYPQIIAGGLAAVLLAGCVHSEIAPRDYLAQDIDKSQALVEVDVVFGQAPDDKLTSRMTARNSAEYAGAPHIVVPFYQKGLGFDQGFAGTYMFAVPYPIAKVETATASSRVFGQKLDGQQPGSPRYRFRVPGKAQWNSNETFMLSFARKGRREEITFRFSNEQSCPSAFLATTPLYGFPIKVVATFKGNQGCLKVCDSRDQWPGFCAFQPPPAA
ncbi:hypothetical protein JAB5_10570 [Janthinobacterium sp. HH103]|uniref:hypothetical protein n=1 Tax=unclassified Janthinobacterium TaxID=2610881 RepID=UPI0008751561|nr:MULTISPECIES: hypothetical protein [unclassified Janthinobacterium]OEZ72850.1 hypothetical protein JAB2_04530 [Janthinobacterium sp. HH100]OEZ86009.1 hypothetical protein JAB5_10570 [Janthinobacterium sp. HH103]QOU73756.1 hypothetical protein JAB4_032150 [Janthinobacterium sp. HH102]